MSSFTDVDPAFWSGKSVFLTGESGFKGSWLSLWLSSLGAGVTGYALEPPTVPSLYALARVDRLVDSVRGDIRDEARLIRSMQQAAPEIVVHMAAQPLVRRSYADPAGTYETNVMGTVHVLEAVRQTPSVRAVVIITTDKCYENKEWVWSYREDEPMGGYDPYSSSKGCAELVVSAYRRSFFNPADYQKHGVAIATARAGNVIGGGDWAQDRLVPDIIRSLEQGQAVEIRNPHATRPWQFVLEPLSGYLILAQKLYLNGPEYSGGWNFGPRDEDAREVLTIVRELCRLWGGKASYFLSQGDHPHEASYLKLDISKAAIKLGWKPAWHLDETLAAIVAWQRGYNAGADMQEICLNQICQYQKARENMQHD
ncbi:MAG: CDP-glucose 4,6-dehydratase [Clostridiaceae bacterium]|nr:CDP-glucose 4,6-dehydratase [Clostridiaceae bacterium]